MRGGPSQVANSLDTSRGTYAKIRQNRFGRLSKTWWRYPSVFRLLEPMIAGAVMAFSSVSVVSNALLLRRWKASR